MEHKTKFYLIVGLQIIFLIGMILLKQSTIAFGQKVLLKPIPYDPTDILRGDYINIRYEISDIRLDSIKRDAEDYMIGDVVFVKLEKGKEYWKAVEISKKRLQNPYIKGIIRAVNKMQKFTIKDLNSSKQYEYEQTTPDYVYNSDYKLSIGDRVQFNVFNDGVTWASKCLQHQCKGPDDYSKIGTVINMGNEFKELSIDYPISTYFVPKNEGNLPQIRLADMLIEAAIWRGDAIATNILINGQKIDFR